SPLFGTAMREATTAAAEGAFQTVGQTILTKAVEGSLAGAASATFQTAASESTWKGGFESGITTLAANVGTSAAIGAGAAVGLHLAGEGIGALRGGGEVADTG